MSNPDRDWEAIDEANPAVPSADEVPVVPSADEVPVTLPADEVPVVDSADEGPVAEEAENLEALRSYYGEG
ncbi:MAG: hypothetical protein M3291_08445 [Actinomycetota bacterium]|nr:hypothetical protein [Actinomycetota bacterium]